MEESDAWYASPETVPRNFGTDLNSNKHDFVRVLSSSYVNDAFITDYCALKKTCVNAKKKVRIMPAWAFQGLLAGNYQALPMKKKQWIETCDIIVWVINHNNTHWSFAYHSPTTQTQVYYVDSFNFSAPDSLVESINKFGEKYSREWLLDPVILDVPQQTESECGVCVNEFIARLIQDQPLTGFTFDGPLFRIRQAAELWNATNATKL